MVKSIASVWGARAEAEGEEAARQAACEEMGGLLNESMASFISGEKARCYKAKDALMINVMIRVQQKEWR